MSRPLKYCAVNAGTDLASKAKTGGNEALASHASEMAKSDSIYKARNHCKMASGEAHSTYS